MIQYNFPIKNWENDKNGKIDNGQNDDVILSLHNTKYWNSLEFSMNIFRSQFKRY